jgi:GTPase SAR1 family protein
MPISPRFHLGKQRRPCYPDKEFTNRDSQRSSFQTVVGELANVPEKGAKFKVITYYGVGGVGKSSLLKQLRKDLLKQSSKAAYSSVDFADPSLRVVSRALLELQRNITCNERLSLPHFELAYSLYFKKRNPDFVFKERELPFKEESSLIGDLLGTLDGIGIAGAVTGGVSIAYKLFSKYGLEKELKNELVELEEYSAIEIEERLPAFFSYDLKRIIKQKEVPVFVAFFDTYEALWEEGKTDANLFSQDSWVRELVAHLPGVLFVFSGRDKLRWSTIDSDWENHLDQYLIDNLSEQDANIFLLNCGVEDEILRGKIISASSGHPYHLNLSVDTYYELKNQGLEVTLEKFASSKRQVLDRFLRNLETSEIETLKILCVSRFFNKNLFEVMISNFRTGYPITKFDDFNRFCFINYENGKYFIHDLMRNIAILFDL